MSGNDGKMEEIDLETLLDGLSKLEILTKFEAEFGSMPHPLRFFRLRRWLRELQVFKKGVEYGEERANRRWIRSTEVAE